MIAGIDPGLTGGLAVLDDHGQRVFLAPLPLIAGREVATHELRQSLELFGVGTVYLERAQAFPKMGVSGAFSYGAMFGAIYATCLSVCAVVLVSPVKWHKTMCAGTPVDAPTKARALIAAERLFPGVDLRATAKSRKAHEGMMDALLIAEYGRRQEPVR